MGAGRGYNPFVDPNRICIELLQCYKETRVLNIAYLM